MIAKTTLAASLLALAALATPQTASAAPGAAPLARTGSISLVEKVQWRRCRYWRRECAFRWGWRTRGFRRCLWRHGC